MPDLLNVLDHKKNSKVSVNGTIYDIGPDGVVRNVSDDDAARMLQNDRVWKNYDPKRASAIRAQAKAEAPPMQLLDVSGDPVKDLQPDKPGAPMDPNLDVYKRPPVDDPGPPPVPEQVEEAEPAEEPAEDVGNEEPEAEASDEVEWPDPKASMEIGYLREMAEAYEVEFTPKTAKKTLVKRISAAMYPDE